jgi:hypothetical protein
MASAVPLRRLLGTLASLLFAAFVVTGSAGTAHAADGFRYWNYFHLENGSWAFSTVGAGDYDPKDGAVEGYRFGSSFTAEGIPPRADLAEVNFDTVCDGTEAAAGEKRVAVVIDYGTEDDADGTTPPQPRAECAVVAADANGQQVISSVADVRAEKGLTCALDGYPVQGCGEPVSAEPPTAEQPVTFTLPEAADAGDAGADADTQDAAAADDDNDLLWPLVGVGAVVVVIAAGGLALSRRNSSA